MAFMMPVIKNDWDVYKLQHDNQKVKKPPQGGRTRTISGTRSECQSLATSPQDRFFIKYHPHGQLSRRGMRSMPASHRGSRMPSVRASQVSLPSSPSKLIEEEAYLNQRSPKSSPKSPSENSLNKFHLRLMERLRKSLRISKDEDETEQNDSPTKESPK